MKTRRFAPKLTRQQRLFIVRAHKSGFGSHSLARALGVRRSTIRWHIGRDERVAPAAE